MTNENSKILAGKPIPSYASYKDVENVNISDDNLGDIVVFLKNSINLSNNKALTVQENEISLADSKNQGEAISQEFTMTWINGDDGIKEIEFNGLTGSLQGQSGKPGVVFDTSSNSIKVNLLLSRPEGSFGLISKNGDAVYMIIAAPNQNGLPDSTKIFVAPFTNGFKMPSGWWHSVPFPHPNKESIHVEEFIIAGNENTAINISEEAGTPMLIEELKL